MLCTYCNHTREEFSECEIERGIYFVVQHHNDMMDERVFQYSIHGGKAKEDDYFKDYFRVPDFVNMKTEEITDDDIDNLKHAREYLKGNG